MTYQVTTGDIETTGVVVAILAFYGAFSYSVAQSALFSQPIVVLIRWAHQSLPTKHWTA
jgi:hypothetical protein